jgi:hypothetical protein
MTRRRGARGIVVQYDGETDYGGREFLVVFGKAPMTDVAHTGRGTALSDSTIQITTGLSDVYSFGWSMESSAATAAATYVRNLSINWQKGYIDDGGVTLTLYSAATSDNYVGHPMIPMVPGSRDWSGCTLNWIAIGKERRT